MDFNITVCDPSRTSPAFDDVMIAVSAALRDLGHSTVSSCAPQPGHIDVLFGHYLAPQRFPDASVVYQLEQVCEHGLRHGLVQVNALRRHVVWDYSRANVEYLRTLGVQAHYVPIGHHPALQRVRAAPEQDIDVLFYGVGGPRRELVFGELRRAGLHMVHANAVYGAELDALIARSKVVLNLHSRKDFRALESVRVGYLMSNRKAVVAEVNHHDDDDELSAGIVAVPYHRLVEACVGLVRDDTARAALEARAYDVISRRPTAHILTDVLHTVQPLAPRVGAWGPH
ncbi:CgeB family protein [Nocardia macrotermitis]|uniref:Glycosyltransferase n=1 Tax=Nocardia macrotermitis TaxID=2585198 RepID=A0A7K0D9N2_9NOCA|nr:hypothetical protein [Nocardia macrotermitis]MQY22475.1 hypothetical protein [Nocardia macrotermitis]